MVLFHLFSKGNGDCYPASWMESEPQVCSQLQTVKYESGEALTCRVSMERSPLLVEPRCPRGEVCDIPHPLPCLGPADWDYTFPLSLTTDTASSKPSAPQLMTRARTPSRQTLGAKKANQHPPGWGGRRPEGQGPREHRGCGSPCGPALARATRRPVTDGSPSHLEGLGWHSE